MADLAQLESALVKADAAGDAEGARVLAGEIRRMRAAVPAQPQPAAAPEPSSTLPANAGVAKLLTSLAGLPVDTVENIINLGIAGAGTAATAARRPDLAPDPLKGSVGGSQWMQDKLRATGQPGLSPDNPQPQSDLGTLQYDFVSRGGPLPGGALPAAGSIIAEKIGGPEWAGVGSLVPSAAITAFNAARAPGLAKLQAQNQVRDATLKEAQEAGYVVPPSQVNPTFLGNRAESVAGKAAINQQATIKNQQVTNALARRAVGLPENAPLTEQALEAQRSQFATPYREIAGMSSRAKVALEQLKDARFKANAFYRHYDIQGDPNSLASAKALTEKASAFERVIEKEASRLGKPELVPALRQARTNIAKTYDVERALNVGDGNVDARILGRALDKGKALTGDLAIAARFAEAFPQVTRSAASVGAPGVSKVEAGMAALLGFGGHAAMGPGGAVLAALPLASHPTRGLLLSDLYQRNFARPNYQPAMLPENNPQSLARIAIMANEQARNKEGRP